MAGRIGAADHRADRCADNNVRDDAMGEQDSENTDMGQAARGAAAEREPDHRAPNRPKPDLLHILGFVLSASDQNVQHQNLSRKLLANFAKMLLTSLNATAVPRQKLPEAWFMPRSGSVGRICDWIATTTPAPCDEFRHPYRARCSGL